MHLAGSSRKSYHGLQKIFIEFCANFGFDPLTVSEDELCMAAAHYAMGHTVMTVDGYMSALQDMYNNAGAGPLPRGAKYINFVRGLKRLLGPADEVVRTKATSVEELHKILGSLDKSDVNDVSFGAEICVAFFLALRTEDHTDGRLRWGDIFPQADGSIELLLPPGKSVHRYRRVAIEARRGVLSSAEWLARLAAMVPQAALAPNMPVFISRVQRRDGGWRFPPLSRSKFILRFKTAVQQVLGFSPALYAGYSLRRGGVTEMLTRGVPVPVVKQHVGWSATSDAVMTYYDHSGRAQMRIPTAAMGQHLC